jgi:predicted SprT family Zn-dependent metalloprotease
VKKAERIKIQTDRIAQIELWCRAHFELPMPVKWNVRPGRIGQFGETHLIGKPTLHAAIDINSNQTMTELEDTCLHELCHVYLYSIEDLMGQDIHSMPFWWLYKKFYDLYYTEGGGEVSRQL